ncbi:MAG TPA: tetratricopeptide repeat protein [Candidatus Binatia bacterium]
MIGGGVGYLFYHNGHTVSLLLGPQSSLELPMAALVLGALALGAALVLLGGMLRSSVSSVSSWREQRRERKRQSMLRVRDEGHRRLWSGDFDTATRRLERYVERHPRDLEAVMALARTYEARGELETARRLLESARSQLGSEPRLLHQLGLLAMRRGNAGAAIDWLQEAVRLEPDSPRLLADLTAALAAEGRFADAAASAQRLVSVEREPLRRAEAQEMLLAMRYRAADADAAGGGHALRRILGEAPDFLPAVVALAQRARAAGDVRAAERLYRDAIRRNPSGVLLERLTALHASTGQAERSLPILRDACAGNRLAAPRLMLARTLVATGRHSAAEAELAEIVKDTPTYRAEGIDVTPERDLVAGELALARGHDREAATLLARAATGSHRPFAYSCRRCGRESAEWRDRCACGAYGTFEWIVAQPVTERGAGSASDSTAIAS